MLKFLFNINLEFADLISITSLIVNTVLAIWVVNVVQDKQSNRRTIKDHFIEEVKDLRNDYRIFLKKISSNNLKPSEILPTFKLLNIKSKDLITLIRDKHPNLDSDCLNPYQVDLRKEVTEMEEFINAFKKNDIVKLNGGSLESLISFQQHNNYLFNKLIVSINDYY